jgi:hypothetical protein
MHINFIVVLLTGLIPSLLGFVWYHPKVMGTVWGEVTGIDPSEPPKMNMAILFGVSILLSIMLAGSMLPVVIHQMGLSSMLMDDPDLANPNSELSKTVANLMAKYGTNYRSFKHGALHGLITSVFLILPVMATNALFERKSAKYIGVNFAYWAICLALMGGVICQFA